MRAYVLRTCFVADRLWEGGTIQDIPDSIDLEKNVKNFKPVEAVESPNLVKEDEISTEIPEVGQEATEGDSGEEEAYSDDSIAEIPTSEEKEKPKPRRKKKRTKPKVN
jgi:hypothetical protein